MPLKLNTTTVQIGEGVLRVGDHVYPLRQIARVSKSRLEIDRGKVWGESARMLLSGLLVAAFLLVCMGIISNWALGGAISVVIAAFLLLGAVGNLVLAYAKPPLFGLVLNTSGTDMAAVWSTDAKEIEQLIAKVTASLAAPDGPMNVFSINNHVKDGDINQVFGGISGKNVKVGDW